MRYSLVILLVLMTIDLFAAEVINAVVIKDYKPYYYYNEKTGVPYGFAIDSFNHVAQIAGLKVNYKIADDWHQLNNKIVSGLADVIPSSGISDKRRQSYYYTAPLTVTELKLYTSMGNSSLRFDPEKPSRLGLEHMSIGYDLFNMVEYPKLILKAYHTPSAAITALSRGEVDFILYPTKVMKVELMLMDTVGDIVPSNNPTYILHRAIAVSHRRPLLFRQLSEAVNTYKASTLYTLDKNRWLRVKRRAVTEEELLLYGTGLVLFFIFITALLRYRTLHTSNIRLMRQIKKRRMSEEQLKNLIDAIPDIIWLKDKQGRYILFNKRFESLCGLPASKIIGKTASDVVPTQYGDHFVEQDAEVMHYGEVITSEYHLTFQHDKHREDIELIRAPMTDAQGDIFGIVGIGRNITSRLETERQIVYNAQHDKLTGLPNRDYSIIRLEECINTTSLDDVLGIIYTNFDNFKAINDSFGYEIGDLFLKKAAGRLVEALKTSSHFIGRLSGDEFIILTKVEKGSQQLTETASLIVKLFNRPIVVDEMSIPLTISAGVAVYPKDARNHLDLLTAADTAMATAKLGGKSQYQRYTDSMYQTHIRTLSIRHSLYNSLILGEFSIHYQLKYCYKTQQVSGAEALMRWTHRQIGVIGPDEFIPIAEQGTVIHDLGVFLIDTTLGVLRDILDSGAVDFIMAINASPKQLICSRFINELRTQMAHYHIEGRNLEIEVTEGVIIIDDGAIGESLKEIREMGIGLAMDDFGTGYSALSYLRRFPFTVLKIDKTFIERIDSCETDAALVASTITLAHAIGLKVVAEGIETKGHAELLADWGCDYAQGFYYHKPVNEHMLLETYSMPVHD